MQKLLSTENNKKEVQFCKSLTMDEIEKLYIPKNKTLKIGLEYERISLDKKTYKTASYEKLEKIIEHFSTIVKWDLIYDNKTIIGAKNNDGSSISLEPGCQLELSLHPEENIVNIESKASAIIELIDKIALIYDVIFIGYGINPNTGVDEIDILNKSRYRIMDAYLPYCKKAELCTKMMRSTAGIQINIDYFDKKDAYEKLKFLNLISPFITGLCANSPIENNKITGYKSTRANVWMFTGKNRCNSFYKNIFNKKFLKQPNIFKNYINSILNVPMVYISKNGIDIPINGKISFKEYLKKGYLGYSATLDDYILHQSLCFPDIRLKNYIEIRNHDSSNLDFALALCAFYKGLSKPNFTKLLKDFNFLKLDQIETYNKNSAKNGLDFDVNTNIDGWDIINKLFLISSNNLNSKERSYLEPIHKIIERKQTQADLILEYGYKNSKDLIDYLYE